MPSQLPYPHHFVYCIENIKYLWILHLIFYACPSLRFLDVETNVDQRSPVSAVCRLLCSNVRGLAGNLIDLTVGSSRYDILLCSETGLRHASRVGVTGSRIWSPCFVVPRQVALGPGGWWHTYEMDIYHFANPNLSVVVAKCWSLWFVV